MKRISKVLAVIAVVLSTAIYAKAGDVVAVCNNNVKVNVIDLAPTADFSAMVVKYVVEVAPDAIENCTSLLITPVIKTDDQKVVSEILVINGSQAQPDKWLNCRINKVTEKENIRFFSMNEQAPLRIETCKTIPYESWMDKAEFSTTIQKVTYKGTTCINAFPGEEKICAVPGTSEPFKISPVPAKYNFAAPTADVTRTISNKLLYPVNSSANLENYLENKATLEALSSLERDNYYISAIVIDGWASPEASVSFNQKLSTKRANTLKKLVSEKYSFDESMYTAIGSGEYWDSVEAYISTTDNAVVKASKDELLKAIAENSDLDKREYAIKNIAGGKPYKVIYKEVFPNCRFADCKVVYTLKEFKLADAKALYAEDSKELSEREYISWFIQEFNADAALKAAEIYPENASINAFAGCAAASKGDHAKAIEYYKKAVDTPEVANNMGCSYLMLGDVEAAKACFAKCANLNTAEANAAELRKAILNKHYFGK